MRRGDRYSVVVSGMVAGVPRHGGATWAVMQYVTGLRRLGHEVLLVEQLASDTASSTVRDYFADVVAEFGLQERASLLGSDGAVLAGAPRPLVERFCAGADLLLNLSGTLTDEALLDRVPRRAYVDLDPGFTQLWHEVEGADMGFHRHDRFVTVGLAIGDGDCEVPTAGRRWITTPPPVDLDLWPVAIGTPVPALTSIGHWRGYGSIAHRGVHYGQRAHSMRSLSAIPRRVGVPVEFALGIDPGERADLRLLRRDRWRLSNPDCVAATPRAYASYVRSSWAELGIAKSGYVAARSGWFSDRSACYLASGRPVIAQDTGFGAYLPTGLGLFSFSSVDEVSSAVDELHADYGRHRRAARELAEERFDSAGVLMGLMERL